MRSSIVIFLPLLLAISLPWTSRGQAESKASTGVGQIQSVYAQPASSKDGRDPFYPESTRLVEALPVAPHAVEISSLRVPGISGTPGHYMAIINNHAFAIGDEGEVSTPNGRVNVRCLEIQSDHVMVEVNGQIHRINLE
jgi:hypothetical protein